MKLRNLMIKDAPLMLEWMHDPDVVKDLQTNFAEKTLTDCENFIRSAAVPGRDLHLAITSDTEDEYLGTVSLKHMTGEEAEFAITIRKCAMGKGISSEAMRRILRIGLEELKLKRIYWCVSPDNARAVRFYDKNGYQRTNAPENAEGYSKEQAGKYIWYEEVPGRQQHS